MHQNLELKGIGKSCAGFDSLTFGINAKSHLSVSNTIAAIVWGREGGAIRKSAAFVFFSTFRFVWSHSLQRFLLLICNRPLYLNRHEGRTWYSTHRGVLWIASTAKKPDPDEIVGIENFYRTYYNGQCKTPVQKADVMMEKVSKVMSTKCYSILLKRSPPFSSPSLLAAR